MTDGQLALPFAAQHVTQVYSKTVHSVTVRWGSRVEEPVSHTWWSWRCLCGRDPGAEGRAWFGGPVSAEEMAWHHRHDREPALNPSPGPGVARCHAGPGCPCGGGDNRRGGVLR
jgi:hypothetical protein